MKNQIVAKVARAVAQEYGTDIVKEMGEQLEKYSDNDRTNQFGLGEVIGLSDSILNICVSLYILFTVTRQEKPDAPIPQIITIVIIKVKEEILGGDLSPEDREEREQILNKALPHFKKIVEDESSESDTE